MDKQEAIERLKQNKAAAKFYAGMVQNTNAIENELKDIEALDMAIEALLAPQTDYISKVDADWIPITTSEPTTAYRVLVTYNWGDNDYDDYEVSDLDYWVAKSAAEEGNKQCQMFIDHVIAWSFMPQPYKER